VLTIESIRKSPNSRRRFRRRGVAMIETALILMIFLSLVLGMLDFGIAVYRNNVLSEAARQLARQAIVHGKLATLLGTWGPTTYNGHANDSNAIAVAVQPYLVGMDPASVTVAMTWPTSSTNNVGGTVRVTLTASYTPITTFIVNKSFTIQAISEMQIDH